MQLVHCILWKETERLEEDRGFFSGEVVNKCGSVCVQQQFLRGQILWVGCTYQRVLGLCMRKHALCAKAFLSLLPLLPPVPLLCTVWEQWPKGATEGSLKAKHEMLQPWTSRLCFVLPLEPKLVLEPEELRETTCCSKTQYLLKSPDSFSCANKCELGWRAAHISSGPQSPGGADLCILPIQEALWTQWHSQPCSRTLRTTRQTSSLENKDWKDEGF